MEQEIIFYTTAAGNCPVAKFIRDQDDKTAAKITATLEHLEETKQPAHHLFQKMSGTDDLWEVRVKQSGSIYRLLGFFDGQTLIILTSVFQKKTRKTPRQEIRTAEARKADYYKQKGS